jgi:hypothetical protein
MSIEAQLNRLQATYNAALDAKNTELARLRVMFKSTQDELRGSELLVVRLNQRINELERALETALGKAL